MFGWFIRIILMISAPVAGWFVSSEALNYPVIKMVVAIGIFTILAALLAFWPSLADWHVRRRSGKSADRG